MNSLKRWATLSLLIVLVFACKDKDTQSRIEGTLLNIPKGIDKVSLQTQQNNQIIPIENGKFKDTLNIEAGFAYLKIGNKGKMLFLDKTSQLKLTIDLNDFQNSVTYSGKGEKENNYLHLRDQITRNVFVNIDSINSLDQKEFDAFLNKLTSDIKLLLDKNKDIHPKLIKVESENLDAFADNLKQQYTSINKHSGPLTKGAISPEFNHLENYKGGDTSLKDLRGNYVYIDIWATWCPPCKAEIPHLKKLEKKFHNKNIKFVSISIDNPSAKHKWQQMIEDKKMGGVQLFAGNDRSFIDAYKVQGIPRFILLDTEGKIIDANAPRPSSRRIKEILKDLP